ncbi:MAG: FAD-dependent monooxygenase [Acidimicrobiaceae bacterium]|nr:FAD-dependent monooxygenase [Acidimicrobiaceae bacterium]MBO0747119.1 FAD-dependent monooxygenase [Acidimicrobiaceae bacterium]
MQGLRVTIIGAGIGGLSAALALHRFGHHPRVLEQTRELRPVGAGISLWPNGVKVLNLLGVGADVAACGGRMERMAYADWEGRDLIDFSLSELYERVGERAWPVPRAELQNLLSNRVRSEIGPEAVQLGVRATGVVERDDGVCLQTEDGRSFEGDLVVAADGAHSLFRDHVAGAPVERRYVGYVNWNGLLDDLSGIAPPGTWLTWVGHGQRASAMPVGNGRAYFFFDVPLGPAAIEPDARHPEALLGYFEGWAEPVLRMIERLDVAGVARVPIYDLDPLRSWSRGRVVLLGDAAHVMTPDLGQGGCQAMEDAWVLTHYLTATTRSVPDALERYQAERIPHTADMIRRARNRARLTHGVDPDATAAWYRSLETDGHQGIIDGLAQSVESGPCR